MDKIYLSLFRGINVSGKNKLEMKLLKSTLEEKGFKDVETYIQSGNVVLSSDITGKDEVKASIEKIINEKWGYDIEVFVFSSDEWFSIVEMNPYGLGIDDESKHVYITVLNAEPNIEKVENLLELSAFAPDEIKIQKQTAYLKVDSYGKTKLSNNFIESKLKLKATTRNWKTCCTLYKMLKN